MINTLTDYGLARLEYLSYHEGHPEKRGGLTDMERDALFCLRKRIKVEEK